MFIYLASLGLGCGTGLSCSRAHGIFPAQGSNQGSLVVACELSYRVRDLAP